MNYLVNLLISFNYYMLFIFFQIAKPPFFNNNYKKKDLFNEVFRVWSHLGSNQGPPDYESGALTN
jgi:hypothetical protein